MTQWSGAVLTGGASSRMGRDKALLAVDGRPMALRVADALTDAGAAEVFLVGGDVDLRGLRLVPDTHTGEGPLDGLVTALRAAEHNMVVVLACDLLEPSSIAIRRLVDGATGATATIPVVAGKPQWLHSAWRRDACLATLEDAFDDGERSIHGAVARLDVRFVQDFGPGFADADAPEDLGHRG